MHNSFTLKVLKKHAKAAESLLNSIDCDFAFTGAASELCGTTTHGWFVTRGISSEYIGVETPLEELLIPYNTIQHGLHFRPQQHRYFRIDEQRQAKVLQIDHGDNTLRLLQELELAIAGNDYSFVRNFIANKREEYLVELSWHTQEQYTHSMDVA